MYRQGDVLLMATSGAKLGREVPPGPRGHILVRGATMFGDGDDRVIAATEPFVLAHETDAGVATGEHATLAIPAGTYLVIRQSQ